MIGVLNCIDTFKQCPTTDTCIHKKQKRDLRKYSVERKSLFAPFDITAWPWCIVIKKTVKEPVSLSGQKYKKNF